MATASFAAAFLSSAFAACFAEVCTIPLDTAKVRLQLQKRTSQAAAAGGGGTLATILCIAREEGIATLWKGLIPGLHRQFLYGGLRIGLYEPVKAFFAGGSAVDDVNVVSKILAALTTGVIAIIVASPTDLVKVRLQADGKVAAVKRNYSGALNAYATIVRQEGILALWTGLGPNIARNAIINAAELASYDQFKQSGLGAGFLAVCIGSPVDVVKSRMMGDSTYRNTFDCFAKTLKHDGVGAFYRGFIANFCRIGSWNVIMFLMLEQLEDCFCKVDACTARFRVDDDTRSRKASMLALVDQGRLRV
ncbi:hypothetical protein ACP70R_012161 [Stipagrostis hirtigluma subsp. patula]